MEKRLFLAIGLSLVVVWLWSAGTPKPNVQQEEQNTAQLIDNPEEDVRARSNATLPSPPGSITQPTEKIKEIEQRVEILDSDKLKAEFSNIGAVLNKITIKEHDTFLPIKNITGISGYESTPFILDQISDNEISYSYENNDFKITKSYTVHDGDYIIESRVKVYNKSDMSKLINAEISGYSVEMSNLKASDENGNNTLGRDKSLLEYAVYSENGIHRKAGAFKFSTKENKEEFGNVLWSGFRDRYFCALVKPQYDVGGYSIKSASETQLDVKIKAKETAVSPKNSVQFDSIIYVGPEKIGDLKKYGLGFEKVKRYYRFALFDSIAKLIESLMHFIYNLIPNWGVSIIIVSVIIYFSMYPLTLKGMLSMKRMQSLQPMIAKLKEKHKDNPQKMNKEMMELYKEYKVNPLGGCLPMLLQMPVFIGLYQVLWRSVSFKGAKFLWIKDLSEPDRLFLFPFKIPFVGNEFNVLPIVMIVVMYFQQKLSSKNMVMTDPAQVAQQKMMSTIMPVFLGVIFYKFASGLTLYFTMFYLFSTFTQWKMSKVKKGA